MLEHLNPSPRPPKRVVVMGAGGFVGGALVARLEREGIPVLPLGRTTIDLLSNDAPSQLVGVLQPGDAFVAVSAIAPCKDSGMLVENMLMARAMVHALSIAPVAHVVNISSDAVYADGPVPLTEASAAAPGTLHGVMHLARELMFRAEVKAPLALLRPSLLYGAKDPHNGYGPNRFRRLAMEGKEIVLFGEGEERRDHVFVDDAAELALRVLQLRSTGALNVACGEVRSFRDVALTAIRLANKNSKLRSSPRSGPMPHNGYRPFDVSAVRAAFPDFRFTPFDAAYARAFKEADHG